MEALRQLCSSTLAALPGGVSQGVKVDAEALLPAVEFALRDGSAAQVYALLSDLYARVEVTVMPERLELVLVEHGLHPDALLSNGTCYLHHRLGRDIPPAKGLLQSILSKHPNTDLRTPSGDTALHLLVKRTLQRQYYPSSQITGDTERAEYLTAAFPLMIQEGYSTSATDAGGKSVVSLLRDWYAECAKPSGAAPASSSRSAMLVAIRASLERCGEEAPAEEAAPGSQAGPSTPQAVVASQAAKTPTTGSTRQPQHPLLVPTEPPEESLNARITFGKHSGTLISEIPYNYIAWMCSEPGFWDNMWPGKRDLLRHLKALGRVREMNGRVEPVRRGPIDFYDDLGHDGIFLYGYYGDLGDYEDYYDAYGGEYDEHEGYSEEEEEEGEEELSYAGIEDEAEDEGEEELSHTENEDEADSYSEDQDEEKEEGMEDEDEGPEEEALPEHLAGGGQVPPPLPGMRTPVKAETKAEVKTEGTASCAPGIDGEAESGSAAPVKPGAARKRRRHQ